MAKVEEIKLFVTEWLNLFPPDVRWNNVLIKSKVDECVNKMQKFLKTYPQYNKELIFAATKNYLSLQESKAWEYTRQAKYFIDKQGHGSLLEQYCEAELQGVVTKAKSINGQYSLQKESVIPINFYNDFI
jgi:hypothetical protein